MSLAVTINIKGSAPSFLCTINDDEIEELLEKILLEFYDDYGKENVELSEVQKYYSMTQMYPFMYKVCKISCKSLGNTTYDIWVEFHKNSITNLDRTTIRKFVM